MVADDDRRIPDGLINQAKYGMFLINQGSNIFAFWKNDGTEQLRTGQRA